MTAMPDKVRNDGAIVRAEEATDAVVTLLRYLGEEPDRDGLLETPARVVKALRELTSGYTTDPATLLKVFDNDADYDELVVVGGIPFYSMCEHHMLPFRGQAHVGYIPGAKIVGLSKLARVVDAFARRLQVQERLTQQVAALLDETLSPLGVIVIIEAEHFCMCMRGVQKEGALTRTSALRGVFRDDAAARAEAMQLLLTPGGTA